MQRPIPDPCCVWCFQVWRLTGSVSLADIFLVSSEDRESLHDLVAQRAWVRGVVFGLSSNFLYRFSHNSVFSPSPHPASMVFGGFSSWHFLDFCRYKLAYISLVFLSKIFKVIVIPPLLRHILYIRLTFNPLSIGLTLWSTMDSCSCVFIHFEWEVGGWRIDKCIYFTPC